MSIEFSNRTISSSHTCDRVVGNGSHPQSVLPTPPSQGGGSHFIISQGVMTMTTDSFFALMCMSLFAFLFGAILAFSGYRFFLFLLPVWGFFFGFGLGAQTIQAIFGTGFLSDVTSWVVGFFVA